MKYLILLSVVFGLSFETLAGGNTSGAGSTIFQKDGTPELAEIVEGPTQCDLDDWIKGDDFVYEYTDDSGIRPFGSELDPYLDAVHMANPNLVQKYKNFLKKLDVCLTEEEVSACHGSPVKIPKSRDYFGCMDITSTGTAELTLSKAKWMEYQNYEGYRGRAMFHELQHTLLRDVAGRQRKVEGFTRGMVLAIDKYFTEGEPLTNLFIRETAAKWSTQVPRITEVGEKPHYQHAHALIRSRDDELMKRALSVGLNLNSLDNFGTPLWWNLDGHEFRMLLSYEGFETPDGPTAINTSLRLSKPNLDGKPHTRPEQIILEPYHARNTVFSCAEEELETMVQSAVQLTPPQGQLYGLARESLKEISDQIPKCQQRVKHCQNKALAVWVAQKKCLSRLVNILSKGQ